MKLSRRTNTIILWIISIGLLVGMIITFTPTGNLFGGGVVNESGAPVLLVNGEPIGEFEVERARQSRLYSAVSEGQAADDLQLLLLDTLISTEVLEQAAARTRVSGGEVRARVNEFRAENNVAGSANDQRYRSLIGRAGYTDAAFRDYIEEQLRQEKYLDEVTGEIDVTDEEVLAFYEANERLYSTDERIRARQIVVEDEALANDLYARLLAGEDFSTLAQEYSADETLAESAGALGATAGSTDPNPVGRAALPVGVANAAFGLQGPGLTDVVEAGGRYYIVEVEEYLEPTPRPFEEVEAEVREDALETKRSGERQRVIEALRREATVTIPEGSPYAYENPVVARVGEDEILESELVRRTYLDPQVQNFLSPDSASLITDFFKPTFLEQLIDQELAYQGAQELDIDLIGPEPIVAQSALNFVSEDVNITPEDIEAYYEANQARFTLPARAVATRFSFEDQASALEFREAVLAGDDLNAEALTLAADAAGGEVQDLGAVSPGELPAELDTVLFETDAFESIPGMERQISDVLVVSEPIAAEEDTNETVEDETGDVIASDEDASESADESADVVDADEEVADTDADEADVETVAEPAMAERFVVLIATRVPERVRPLSEVLETVETAVRNQKRQELRDAWLEGLREEIPVENLLAEASPAEVAPTTEGIIGEEAAGGVVEDVEGVDEPEVDITTETEPVEDSVVDDPDALTDEEPADGQ